MLRIAVGGIHTECSTYSPVLMTADDFRVLRGEDLPAADYFAFLPRPDVELRPLLHARAVPGGPVAAPTYAAFKAEFLDRLRAALPLDGIYLAMHGAMHVDGQEDAEGDWIGAVRDLVGPDTPVAAVHRATTDDEDVRRCRLDELAVLEVRSPAVIVIGAVAALDLRDPLLDHLRQRSSLAHR